MCCIFQKIIAHGMSVYPNLSMISSSSVRLIFDEHRFCVGICYHKYAYHSIHNLKKKALRLQCFFNP